MIGQPWMSMSVGAVMPRQKTAFASEERKRRAAAKQATATPTKNNRCIGLSAEIRARDAMPGPRLSQEVPEVMLVFLGRHGPALMGLVAGVRVSSPVLTRPS